MFAFSKSITLIINVKTTNMKIYLEPEYKKKVLQIWSKHDGLDVLNEPGFEYRKSPLLPEYVLKNAILFIGINPSFNKKASIHPNNKLIEFYPIKNDSDDITYFNKFKDISKYCNNEKWTHLDLFFIRETNQKVIKKMSYKNITFLEEQLKLTFEIIKKASPKIIVVSNAFGSEFFGKLKKHHLPKFNKIWMGHQLDFKNNFDTEIGTYKINIDGNFIPIIFSGMLSGKRALDIGSFERLKWQIKRILEIEKK